MYLPVGEMSIILDDVFCLLHLLIIERLLDHPPTQRLEQLDLTVKQLNVDASGTQKEIKNTKVCHATFSFLIEKYINHLNVVVNVVDEDAYVANHKHYACCR